MLGSDVLSVLLAGSETGGELAMLEGTAIQGSGPGPHTDPWRESFYILEGELTFELERDGRLEHAIARAGDAVSVPAGVGHGFTSTAEGETRFIVMSVPAGLDRFFADAGEGIDDSRPPTTPHEFDRTRLQAAFRAHGLRQFTPTTA
jgi:quercetin dioxygenase-like cupin family protein